MDETDKSAALKALRERLSARPRETLAEVAVDPRSLLERMADLLDAEPST